MDFSHILTDSYTLTLVCLLVASLIILSLYYGLFYMGVGRYKGPRTNKKKEESKQTALPPVSVVMTAHNDADKLRANLLYVLEQDYPTFEVVVVDYRSSDDSKYVLQMLSQTYNHLKVVHLDANPNGFQGLKYPFSMGVKSAQYDLLLLTETDCVPKDVTNFCWIREMVAGYVGKQTEMVLGYCGIQPRRSPINWLQQYDNLDYSVEYLGAAIHRRPFTGCGRNLSYKRSLFMKSGGFIYHYHIPDGADDMFVCQNATRRNTSVVLSDGALPAVEAVQPACGLQYFQARTEVEMICVSKDYLRVDVLAQLTLVHSLHTPRCTHRHKDRGRNIAVCSVNHTGTRVTTGVFSDNVELHNRQYFNNSAPSAADNDLLIQSAKIRKNFDILKIKL